jgi:hypothetical protein
VLSCVGRGLCDELIPRPKESYPVSNKIQKPQKGIGKRRLTFQLEKKYVCRKHQYFNQNKYVLHTINSQFSPSQRPLPTQDNTTYKHKRQTSMPSAGFEPAIPATKRRPNPQTALPQGSASIVSIVRNMYCYNSLLLNVTLNNTYLSRCGSS